MGIQFNQDEVNDFVAEWVLGMREKPFMLVSGRSSHWYANWRDAASDAFLLDKLTDYVLAFANHHNLRPDCFYGVPAGASKTAVVATMKLARLSPNYAPGSHVVPLGREKPKDHGDPKDRDYVGSPRGRTIFIEDVTTTGGSLITAIDRTLEGKIDCEIVAAIGLTHRNELTYDDKEPHPTVPTSVEEKVNKRYGGKIPYLAMSNAADCLPIVAARKKMPDHVLAKVEEEFATYGIRPIKLR